MIMGLTISTAPLIGVLLGGHIGDKIKEKGIKNKYLLLLILNAISYFMFDIVTFLNNSYFIVFIFWIGILIGTNILSFLIYKLFLYF
jgi:hypothetical protein